MKRRPPHSKFETTPRTEAIALYKIYRAGSETAEQFRALICAEPNAPAEVISYREDVLRWFSSFVSAGRIVKIAKARKKYTPKTSARELKRRMLLQRLDRCKRFVEQIAYACARLQPGGLVAAQPEAENVGRTEGAARHANA
jgi:hypothetical protein